MLVIFDCDGVLCDTEPAYFAMNRDFIRRNGGDFDFSYYEHFIGLSADLIWGELKERFRLKETVAELIDLEKQNKNAALREAGLRPMPGARPLLQRLTKQGIPCAVASSGRRDNVELILQKTGLGDAFRAVITGEDVVRGKPAPDIFLKAASACAADAKDCIVIEDSQNGVKAAKAAGMRCAGFINPHSGNQDLSLADVRVSALTDPELFDFLSLNG